VDLGGEIRQVVSGIQKWYEPEKLVGKKVILVANLKPVKLKGEESRGMILSAADIDDENLVVSTIDGDMETGCVVR
jgi:methionyl-tRNA synthetase